MLLALPPVMSKLDVSTTSSANWISWIIIQQAFSLASDLSKRVTRPNVPQLKLGNIRVIFPLFGRICSSKLTVFLKLRSWKTAPFSEQMTFADKCRAKWRLLFLGSCFYLHIIRHFPNSVYIPNNSALCSNRGHARTFLKDLEKIRPSSILGEYSIKL